MSRYKLFCHTDLDGVGCAILAYLAFGRENVDVEYCGYDDVDKKVEKFWTTGGDAKYNAVYITDISISDDLAKLIDTHFTGRKGWHLFDHHATALELNKYGWCDVRVFYNPDPDSETWKTSGTEMFYDHLHRCGYFDNFDNTTQQNIIKFVEIVRDYDTWRWKEELGEEGLVCKQVNDLFYIYGRDEFIEWVLKRLKYYGSYPSFPAFSEIDRVLLKQQQKDIDIYVKQKEKQLMVFHDPMNGITEGVVFAERYCSELGNRLCELHPELTFVTIIDISNGKVSYRTIRDDIDLGDEIAHSHGGGGHRKAAGSTFDGEKIRKFMYYKIIGFLIEQYGGD